MSVIEDSRKVLQDFITLELQAIRARLDVLEGRSLDSVRRRLEKLEASQAVPQ